MVMVVMDFRDENVQNSSFSINLWLEFHICTLGSYQNEIKLDSFDFLDAESFCFSFALETQ